MAEFIITVALIIFFGALILKSPIPFIMFQNTKLKNFEKELRQNSNFNIHSIIYPVAFDLENRQIAIKNENNGYYIIDQSLIRSTRTYSHIHQNGFRIYGIEVHIDDFDTPYLDFWYGNAATRDTVISKINILFNLR